MNTIKNNYYIRKMATYVRLFLNKYKYNISINSKGCYKIKKNIKGYNNKCIIESKTFIDNAYIYIKGNNNCISIGHNCIIGPKVKFHIEGNNIKVLIGRNTTMTRNIELCAQEDNTTINIGEDCMLSNSIIIRTSDSHPIYDSNTHKRLNFPKDIIIGKHVWIAPNSKIMKGSIIGDGSIIGSDTTTTKEYPANCMIIGRPATIHKRNVYWTRESLF